jgi:hypothetical protein
MASYLRVMLVRIEYLNAASERAEATLCLGLRRMPGRALDTRGRMRHHREEVRGLLLEQAVTLLRHRSHCAPRRSLQRRCTFVLLLLLSSWHRSVSAVSRTVTSPARRCAPAAARSDTARRSIRSVPSEGARAQTGRIERRSYSAATVMQCQHAHVRVLLRISRSIADACHCALHSALRFAVASPGVRALSLLLAAVLPSLTPADR